MSRKSNRILLPFIIGLLLFCNVPSSRDHGSLLRLGVNAEVPHVEAALLLICPTIADVQCNADLPAEYTTIEEFMAGTGADTSSECGIDNTSFALLRMTDNGTCPRTIRRVYGVADDCGITTSCTQTITYTVDNEDPVLTCGDDDDLGCNPSFPVGASTVTMTDNCDADVTAPLVSTVADTVGCTATVKFGYSYTDACGNTGSCTQTITYTVDNEDPVLTCGDDDDLGCNPSFPVGASTVAMTDNCDADVTAPLVSTVADTVGCTATVKFGYSYTDACGNTGSCTQTITYTVDTTNPVITCPATATVECMGGQEDTTTGATGSATAIDNCDTDVAISHTDRQVAGECAAEYTIYRAWRAEDDCGNVSSCTQQIDVVDTTMPVITCPATATVECMGGQEDTTTGATGSATAIDNCDTDVAISHTDRQVAGECAAEYTIYRAWRAEDDCGNVSSCTQQIDVVDTTMPVITCPATATVECMGGQEDTTTGATGSATAIDNCDTDVAISNTDRQEAGDCAAEYTIYRTWRATDDCGNVSSCTQTIVVNDTIPPSTINCTPPLNTIVECDLDDLENSVDAWNAANIDVLENCAKDNCDQNLEDQVMSHRDTSEMCGNTGIIRVTYTITDDCGNTTQIVANYTIKDTSSPVLNDINISCESLNKVDLDKCLSEAQAFDGATLIDSVTALYYDKCDQNLTTKLIETTHMPTNDDCSWTIKYKFEISDDCDNPTTCTVVYAGGDSSPPSLKDNGITCSSLDDGNLNQCLGDALMFGGANLEEAVANLYRDDCTQQVTATFIDSTVSGSDCLWIIIYYYRIEDSCDHADTCQVKHTGGDETNPEIICPPDVTLYADAQCFADTATSSTGTATATDNCPSNVTIKFEDSEINSCFGNRVIKRIWTATDTCGKMDTCGQSITVIDTISPMINCPADVTLYVDALCFADTSSAATGVSATATDNCTPVVTISHTNNESEGLCPDERVIKRTWKAEDDCGNTKICIQTITVKDGTAPVIQGVPPDEVVSCTSSSYNLPDNISANDGCDQDVTLIMSFDSIIVTCSPDTAKKYIYTWTAEDNCGNTSMASWTVSVINDFVVTITNDNGQVLNNNAYFCADEMIILDACFFCDSTENREYEWSSTEGFTATTEQITVPANIEATYTVEVKSAAGCCAKDSIHIEFDDPVAVQINDPAVLECGESVILQASGTGNNLQYLWSNGASTESIEVTSAGDYSVTVTTESPFECQAVATTHVNGNGAFPNIRIEDHEILSCLIDTVTLIGQSDSMDVTYSWRKLPNGLPINAQELKVVEAGDYELTVMTLGCSVTETTTVMIDTSAAKVQFDVDVITCKDSIVQINPDSIYPGASFNWTFPDGTTSEKSSPMVTDSGAYTVQITDAKGCDTTITVMVSANTSGPDIDTITATNNGFISCDFDTLTLNGIAGSLIGKWTNEGGQTIADTNTIEVDIDGNYIFMVTDTSNGCKTSDTIEIKPDWSRPPAITGFDFIDEFICEEYKVNLQVLLASYPDDLSYQWSGPDGYESSGQTTLVNMAGTYIVTVTDTTNGCQRIDSTALMESIVRPDLEFSTNPVTGVDNGMVWLDTVIAKQPFKITWLLPFDTIVWDNVWKDSIIEGIPAGRHWVEVVDGNICTERFSFVMGTATTICEYGATAVPVETKIEASLMTSRKAPASFLSNPRVLEAFDTLTLDTTIYLRTYLYESIFDSVTLEFHTDNPGTSRAFLFACDQYDGYSQDICLDVASADSTSTIGISDDEFAYYIVVAGVRESTFDFTINTHSATHEICQIEISRELLCDVEDKNQFITGDSQIEDYTACYNGERSYTGGENIYLLNVESPSIATFAFNSQGAMGVFIFDYQCENRCITYFETDEDNKDVKDTIALNAGYYFMVVDAATPQDANFDYTIGMSCNNEEVSPWPDRRAPDECFLSDPDDSHFIGLVDSSMMFDADILSPSDFVSLHILTPDADSLNVSPWGPFAMTESADIVAYGDNPQIAGNCGFAEGEQMIFRLTRTGVEEMIKCTPTYQNDNGNFNPGDSSTILKLEKTIGTSISVGIVHPTQVNDALWNGTMISFTVQANQNWTIDSPVETWISIGSVQGLEDTLKGRGDGEIQVLLSSNDTEHMRSGIVNIRFEESGSQKQVVIKQQGMIFTSIAVPSFTQKIKVYPNPNSGQFNLDYDFGYDLNFNIHVVDVYGNIVFQRMQLHGSNGTETIDLNHLPSGMYFVLVESEGGKLTSKIVVQH